MMQSTIRALSSCTKTVPSKDFFGIRNITNKDIAAAFVSVVKLPHEKLKDKYKPLISKRDKLANEPVEEEFTYGQVRRDDKNVPMYHGQHDEKNTKRLYDTVTVKQSFLAESKDVSHSMLEATDDSIAALTETGSQPIFENPAFRISEVEAIEDLNKILKLFADEKKAETLVKYSNVPPLIFFFENSCQTEQGWQKLKTTKSSLESKQPQTVKQILNEHSQMGEAKQFSTSEIETTSSQSELYIKRPQLLLDKEAGPEGVKTPLHELNPLSAEFQTRLAETMMNDKFDKSIDENYDVKKKDKQIKRKAIDHLREIRDQRVEPTSKALKSILTKSERAYPLRSTIKLDSKGKRNYKYQVPDWQSARRSEILDFLKDSILYNNYGILAINKPYGLASHSEEKGGETYDMNNLVKELATKVLRFDEVFLTHRLDKTTTGILLFATSHTRAVSLHKQFRADEIKKTYIALTRGTPNPTEGIIDIPIGEMTVSGKLRMCPAPARLPEKKQIALHYAEARRAVTEYETLQIGKGNMSLIQVKPRSGVKHQIRCHLGFGLKTPILGDHKYTDIARIVPQKLPPQALGALKLRQSKVRTLPIHLHARSIVIPNAKPNGENLFITAPLPPHFIQNMRALNLKFAE